MDQEGGHWHGIGCWQRSQIKRSTDDTNQSGGHTAGPIPVANGFQYPRANPRIHSASGRWNENTLVDINPRCFYTCTFEICEIEVINKDFLPTWPALFVCSTVPGHQAPRGRHGRRGRRMCVKHPILPMEWQSRGDYRLILCQATTVKIVISQRILSHG